MFRLWKLIFFFALAVPFCLSACVPVSASGGDAGIQEGLDHTGREHVSRIDRIALQDAGIFPYIDNMLYVFVNDEEDLGDGSFYSQAAWDAAEAVGGKVVGKMPGVPEYQIRTAPMEYSELSQTCECLVNGGPVGFANLDAVDGITGARADVMVPCDLAEPVVSGGMFDSSSVKSIAGTNWSAIIHRDEAWDMMDGKSGVGIGIIDNGFDFSHPDSYVDASDCTKENSGSDALCHGSLVASMAGGWHSWTFHGCAPEGTFVYASDPRYLNSAVADDMAYVDFSGIMESMMECIQAGCKVLNFSIGFSKSGEGTLSEFRDYMAAYLCRVWRECGKDFLVVQSAGNADPDTCDVSDSPGVFCGMTKENLERGMSIYLHSKGYQNNVWQYGYMSISSEKLFQGLRDRIIIVGGSVGEKDSGQCLWASSDYGFGVDIYAPCGDIGIPQPSSGIIGFYNGTSFASPIVAGVASMVWGKYPGLSASSVKDIVVGGTLNMLGGYYPEGYNHLRGTDFVVDAGQAMRYAKEYVGASQAVDVWEEYSAVFGGNGKDTLCIGSANADSHLLDASSRVLPFSIKRKRTASNLDIRGEAYGLMYPKQTGRDGNSYYRVKKPLSYIQKYSGSESFYNEFLCVQPHVFADYASGNVLFQYSFPEVCRMVSCYKLFPVGTYMIDLPDGAGSLAKNDGTRLTQNLLFSSYLGEPVGFSE